jgi:hypothetical protein
MYSDATASEYDSMIHCWAERPACSSRPMVGNAMFTTVPSTNVIDEPMIVAIRVSRRRWRPPGRSDREDGLGQVIPGGRACRTRVTVRPYPLMGVTYELVDGLYPFVSALYTCPCGRHAVRHATEAEPRRPSGRAHRAKDRHQEYICPECVRASAAAERTQE